MKKHLLLGSSLILGCMLLITGCSKDAPVNEEIKTVNSLFQQLKPTAQIFTVNAGTEQTITGAKGTKITFHPQSFKNANGSLISAGTIKIELIEMYKPTDMILNRVSTTTAAQQPLISGGSVNIKATLNDHEVFTNGYGITFKQPAMAEAPMALFNGYQVSDATGTSIKWSDDTTGTIPRTTKDPIDLTFCYAFDTCTNFNWINCDYFYSSTATKTDINILAPDGTYTLDNTQIFVIFPAVNGVIPLYSYNANNLTFSFGFASYFLPVGTNVHVVILGSKNNNYFMDVHQNVTVTAGMTLNFTPTSTTVANIQSTLAAL